MQTSPEAGGNGNSVLLFLFALFLLVSPFAAWWLSRDPPWYVPYALWLVLIALAALFARRFLRHEV